MKKFRFLVLVCILACAAVARIFINSSSKSSSALNENDIDILCGEYTSTKIPNGVDINNYINEFTVETKKTQFKYSSVTKGDGGCCRYGFMKSKILIKVMFK